MNAMLTGAIAIAAWVVALYFLRFYRQTRDTFFAWFALAFVLEGVDRIPQVFVPQLVDDQPIMYVVRLVEYMLIIYAIWHKNRSRR